MVAAVLSPLLKQRFFDANGKPLANGRLYSYVAGSAGAANRDTYASSSMAAVNTNPVILDPNGYADVWLAPDSGYLFVLRDATNALVFTIDNVVVDSGISNAQANVAAFSTYTVPLTVNTVYIEGYYASGDGGGARYARTLEVGPGPGLVQSGGGAWWKLAETVVYPEMFGYRASVQADANKAIQNEFLFGTTNSVTLSAYPKQYNYTGPTISVPASITKIEMGGANFNGLGSAPGGCFLMENGNYANCAYYLPNILSFANGSSIHFYGASFCVCTVGNIQANGDGIVFEIDDTHKLCLDNIVTFNTVATILGGAAVRIKVSGSTSGRVGQGNCINGNFANEIKYGLYVDASQTDVLAGVINDTRITIDAIDGQNITGGYGVYATSGLVGPFLVQARLYFGQFQAGYIHCPFANGAIFELGFDTVPNYASISFNGLGNSIRNTTGGATNNTSSPIQLAVASGSRATFNGGVPPFANTTSCSVPQSVIAGKAAGTIVHAYFYSPFTSGVSPVPSPSPRFSVPLAIIACEDESVNPGGDGNLSPNQVHLALVCLTNIGATPGDQVIDITVGR